VEALLHLVVSRPYIPMFMASFLFIATAEIGGRRTLIWLVSGTFLGWLAEAVSTRTGFPFGWYVYHQEALPDDVWIAGVPLFASVSFAFLSYFGFSVACNLLGTLRRDGWDIQRSDDGSHTGSVQVLLLAALIPTWMDTVTDPVTLYGAHWFLGDLYHYEANGFHFGVPLSNYLGWLFTMACIVFVNQRLQAWLSNHEAAPPRGLALPLKPFWSLGSCIGNFAFLISVTVYLTGLDSIPEGAPLGAILSFGLAQLALFLVVVAVLTRWALQRGKG